MTLDWKRLMIKFLTYRGKMDSKMPIVHRDLEGIDKIKYKGYTAFIEPEYKDGDIVATFTQFNSKVQLIAYVEFNAVNLLELEQKFKLFIKWYLNNLNEDYSFPSDNLDKEVQKLHNSIREDCYFSRKISWASRNDETRTAIFIVTDIDIEEFEGLSKFVIGDFPKKE